MKKLAITALLLVSIVSTQAFAAGKVASTATEVTCAYVMISPGSPEEHMSGLKGKTGENVWVRFDLTVTVNTYTDGTIELVPESMAHSFGYEPSAEDKAKCVSAAMFRQTLEALPQNHN